mgnify:CR=1 FL=1
MVASLEIVAVSDNLWSFELEPIANDARQDSEPVLEPEPGASAAIEAWRSAASSRVLSLGEQVVVTAVQLEVGRSTEQNEAMNIFLSKVLLLSVALQRCGGVGDRLLRVPIEHSASTTRTVTQFLSCVATSMSHIISHCFCDGDWRMLASNNDEHASVIDMIDGLLCLSIMRFLAVNAIEVADDLGNGELAKRLELLWNSVAPPTLPLYPLVAPAFQWDLSSQRPRHHATGLADGDGNDGQDDDEGEESNAKSKSNNAAEWKRLSSLLSVPLIECLLPEVSVSIRKALEHFSAENSPSRQHEQDYQALESASPFCTVFQDRHHYHTKKPLSPAMTISRMPQTRQEKRRADRQIGKLATYHHRLDQSLQIKRASLDHLVVARSDSLSLLRPSTVSSASSSSSSTTTTPSRSSSASKVKPKKQNANKKVSKSAQVRASAAVKIQQTKQAQELKLLSNKIATILVKPSSGRRDNELEWHQKTLALRRFIDESAFETPVRCLAETTLIDWCMEEWHRSGLNQAAACAFRLSVDNFDLRWQLLPESLASQLTGYLEQLGFTQLAVRLLQEYHDRLSMEQRSTSPFVEMEAPWRLSLTSTPSNHDASSEQHRRRLPLQSPQRFQLQHCGAFMQRALDSQRDDRVGTSFLPDRWQRELLDAVDAGHSLLVVAPTSAGKTFISFYAMQQVLEYNLTHKVNRRVAYVAPTKALVAQVSAEIRIRYSSSRYANVVGEFTRDYRHNVESCQVLVTVPQCLDVLVLNSEFEQSLACCILDEVHCIQGTSSDQDGGIVWEHLLALIRCPFIALSATIGNARQLHTWMCALQSRWSRQVVLLQHDHRWGDLVLHDSNLQEIHPLSLVSTIEQLEAVSLSPHQCLQLYECLRKAGVPSLDDLDPDRFFPIDSIISRVHVYEWESRLKRMIAELSTITPTLLRQVQASLPTDVENLEFSASAPRVVLKLRDQQRIPAISFALDRARCMTDALALWQRLREAEKSDVEVQRQWQLYRDQVEQYKQRTTHIRPVTDSLSPRALAELREEWTVPIPPPMLSRHTVVPVGKVERTHIVPRELSDDEQYWFDRASVDTERWLLDALRRGIGVHHAGLSKKYRSAVEALFRSGRLGVVFSTATLALGINAPCRTVILGSDAKLFLDPLMYRQMIGRAGRRGRDDFGWVVFAGNISRWRVQFLVTAPLAPINPSAPITPVFALRAAQLFVPKSTRDREIAALRIRGLLVSSLAATCYASRLSQNALHKQGQMVLILGVCVAKSLQLMSPTGHPIGLAGLAQHLHYHGSGAFALCHLLQRGVLYRIAVASDQDMEMKARSLLHLLSFLFNQVPLSRARTVIECYDASSSIVILPPPLGEWRKELNSYNKMVLAHATTLLSTLGCDNPSESAEDQAADAAKIFLPRSRVSFRRNVLRTLNHNDHDTNDGQHQSALAQCIELTPRFETPFERALSATVQTRQTINRNGAQLHATLESPELLPFNRIPTIELQHADRRPIVFNAIALDFYKHGQICEIERANEMRQGSSWHILNDWSLILKALETSITLLLEQEADHLSDAQHAELVAVLKLASFTSESFSRKLKTAR